VKNEGQEVTIGGKTYILPDLGYGAYEDHDAFAKIINIGLALEKQQSDPLNNPIPKAVFTDIRELIHLALKRNYPDLTLEELKEALGLGSALMAVTKLIQREMEVNELLAAELEKNARKQPTTAKK
jgi:hypothetical protein